MFITHALQLTYGLTVINILQLRSFPPKNHILESTDHLFRSPF